MAEIINLRMARKQKSRKERELKADQNRTLHSIPKKERDLKKAQSQREKALLDGHALESDKKDK